MRIDRISLRGLLFVSGGLAQLGETSDWDKFRKKAEDSAQAAAEATGKEIEKLKSEAEKLK